MLQITDKTLKEKDMANKIIGSMKGSGNTPDTQQIMMKLAQTWLESKDMPMLEELRTYFLPP